MYKSWNETKKTSLDERSFWCQKEHFATESTLQTPGQKLGQANEKMSDSCKQY